MADQSCTITVDKEVPVYQGKNFLILKWAWVAGTGGALTATVSATSVKWASKTFSGWVSAFWTVPTPTPSSYNIQLLDSYGRTIASKTGASTTELEEHTAGKHIVDTVLSVTVQGAGSNGAGTAYALIVADRSPK